MFVPPDADARRAIAEDTESNIVVEAAAGTGKTTCLVARLMTLLRRGVLSGSARFAAVTFTTKAASELRERLEHRLAEALADESEPAESKRNLAAAAVALPECHIGTIHSFCSRLIRERPVEAGVNPDFSEMDNEADALARRQAWDEFTADLAHGTYPDITAAFADFDLDLESLYPGFVRFADFPDIQRWPGRDFQPGAIDTAGFVDSINRFLGRCYYRDRLAAAEPGNDALIPLLRRLDRRMRRIRVPTPLTDAHRLLRILKENPKQVQSMWPQLGVDKKNAKAELIAYGAFLAAEVAPCRTACLALT
ncbi:MAG: UvrD-helicase domain-containing protein, partial [Planctomycetes bacterium]|nr:UvrD-helicase domain-containing protein [Planctomycetota bacterium]